LDTLPRCFESASTTDVSLTSTRRKNTLFGDCPPSAVGKPAGVLLRDPPRARRCHRRSRETPDHLAVIRPPTAPCLTARHRLRVERLPRRCFRVARGERGGFFGRFTLRRSNPLTPPGTIEERNARALPSPIGDLPSTGCTSMLPAFARPRRLPSEKPGSSALASTRPEPRTRWPAGAGAARVHRCSKTSTRPFSAPLSRAFPGRMRFHDFCRSMFQRALPWTARTSRTSGKPWSGRLPVRSIVTFRSRATAEGAQGQGPRITEPRRSLPGLLPGETSPQPRSLQTPRVAGIVRRPVRSRPGRRTKPPAPRTLARHERREGRATPDPREGIRRSPARGAFRREAVRKRGRAPRSA
jgi:hypothetical protein